MRLDEAPAAMEVSQWALAVRSARRFEGKTALVTGGAWGIGSAVKRPLDGS